MILIFIGYYFLSKRINDKLLTFHVVDTLRLLDAASHIPTIVNCKLSTVNC